MSIWELRQAMESAVPWWVPFALVITGLLLMWVFSGRKQ